MTGWRRFEPLMLLFAAGGFVGLIFPMAKLAGQQDLSPLAYAGFAAAGAAVVLAVIARISGETLAFGGREIAYALVAGQLTFAIPFGTLAAIIPLAGSGVPAILQSLAPLLTLGIVVAIGYEQPGLWRSVGLATGFAGVLLILFARGAAGDAEGGRLFWYLVALVTPLSLAAGNVYRSTAWPQGARALPLATVTLAAAAAGLLLLGFVFAGLGIGSSPLTGLSQGWPLIALQSLFTGIGYAFFFRLQQVGGPVYLSQISYVNTGVGVIFAVAVFGERLPLAAWIAAACIFVGIALVTFAPKPEKQAG